MNLIPMASERDRSTARQFLRCCYDDSCRMPTAEQMGQLVALGWVERLGNGAFAETQALKAIEPSLY